jgi:hypothetical protein
VAVAAAVAPFLSLSPPADPVELVEPLGCLLAPEPEADLLERSAMLDGNIARNSTKFNYTYVTDDN